MLHFTQLFLKLTVILPPRHVAHLSELPHLFASNPRQHLPPPAAMNSPLPLCPPLSQPRRKKRQKIYVKKVLLIEVQQTESKKVGKTGSKTLHSTRYLLTVTKHLSCLIRLKCWYTTFAIDPKGCVWECIEMKGVIVSNFL